MPIAMVELDGVAKSYALRKRPLMRMWQALRGRPPTVAWQDEDSFTALYPCDLVVRRGEVLGVVGKNGAGKSTLLQLISGTLTPSQGQLQVRGKVSAILELGAGFNTEFTGRENIYLALATAGMSLEQMFAQVKEIIDFSGIEAFIDQPIKTYSSGMQVRLAFSIATCSQPDVLVIDEALSVGDGEFARKSFDRIMALKDRGTTILFCSHSLFHIEALCERAIWLHDGRIMADGHPGQVMPLYQGFLDGAELDGDALVSLNSAVPKQAQHSGCEEPNDEQLKAFGARGHSRSGSADSAEPLPPARIEAPALPTLAGYARLHDLQVQVIDEDGLCASRVGGQVTLRTGLGTLRVKAAFLSDPGIPTPSFAVTVHSQDGRILGSAGAWNDDQVLQRDAQGAGMVTVEFPALGLLKGTYTVSAFLFCERGLYIYDNADHFARIEVFQTGLEQGYFHFPRQWKFSAGLSEQA